MLTRTCTVCGTEFEKEDVPKEYLYNRNLCSLECQREKDKKRYEKNKKEGVCVHCKSRESKEDCIYCKKCQEKHRKKQKERYEKYKEEGKCKSCGEPALENSTRCKECLDKERKWSKEKRKKYKQNGKCFTCGKELSRDYNKDKCPRCLEKQRLRREEYKEKGLCPDCGEPVSGKSVYCRECLDRQRERQIRLKSEGKCPRCGKKLPDDGREWDNVHCPECLEKSRNDRFYGEYATREELLYGKAEG